MNKLTFDTSWPESWKLSYEYDLREIYGQTDWPGYASSYRSRRKHTLDLVKKVAPKGAKVMDVAAAQGNFSLSMAEMGYDVTWNDLRDELVDYVKLKYERGKLDFAPGNAFELGFDSQFDVVLITEIIEHVAHPDEFLALTSRLVKPGGHVIMTTPNGGYFINRLPKFSECADPSQFESVQFKPNSDGHIFLLHLDEIEKLARQANLEVVTTEIFSNSLTSGHIKTEAALKILPLRLVVLTERMTRSLPRKISNKLNSCMAVVFRRPLYSVSQ